MSLKAAVIGSGSWGTALANLLADAGHSVTIWGRDSSVVDSIKKDHQNKKNLPGLALNPKLSASTDLQQTLSDAELIVCSIPTQQIRGVFSGMGKVLGKKPFINSSKGIETKSLARICEVVKEISPESPYIMLSGPSFAEEVVKRLPTAVTVAAADKNLAAQIQQVFRTPYFRCYASTDVIGVELAGALKNVIAVASGIVSGLNLGYNAQAAIINRGITEIARLAKKQGGDPLTFLGLAGMGDLVLTCTGPLSRNRRLGEALGKGKDVAQAAPTVGGVAEGYFTSKAAHDLMKRYAIELPIMEQVYKILYEGGKPQQALVELMSRDLKDEWDSE